MKTNFSKNLFSVFLLVCCFAFAACDNDKNDSPAPEDLAKKVEGSWTIKTFTIEALGATTDYLSDADSTGAGKCLGSMISTFKTGGKIDVTAEKGCDVDDNLVSPTDTWEIVGNKIRLKDEDGFTEEFELAVDSNEMKWTLEAEAMGIKAKTNIVFEKK